MAASTSAQEDDFMRLVFFINNESRKALHIVKSEERSAAYEQIISNKSFKDFVLKLEDSLDAVCLVYGRPSVFEYFQNVNQYRSEFLITFAGLGKHKHLNELFNFYNSNVYDFLMSKRRVLQSESDSSMLNKPDPDAKFPMPENYKEEPESALLRLGGGTMGEIWRRSKKNKEKATFTLKRKVVYRKLYGLTFDLRMRPEEKEYLPKELKNRDRGGMFFPKKGFLPFIQKLNDYIRTFANPLALKEFGKDMIKKCVAHVKEQGQLKEMFMDIVTEIGLDTHDRKKELELFFSIWIRKMTHARIQEFVSYYGESVKKIGKGGQTLRDKLFSSQNNFKRRKGTFLSKARQAKQTKRIPKNKRNSYQRKQLPANKKTNLKKVPKPLILEDGVTISPKLLHVSNRSSKREPKCLVFDDFLY